MQETAQSNRMTLQHNTHQLESLSSPIASWAHLSKLRLSSYSTLLVLSV